MGYCPRAIRVGIICAWPRDVARGSGTARFLQECTAALEDAGVSVASIGIDLDPTSPDFVRRRFAWNEGLADDPRLRQVDVVLAIDYDGYALPRGGVPRVVCPQGVFAEIAATEPEPSRSVLLEQAAAERRNVHAASAVITPSRFAADAIARHYGVDPARVHSIPHGFDIDSWCALLDAAPSRTESRPTVLAVAKLYPRKGIDTLLTAVAELRGRMPDLRARIVGGGPDASRLHALSRQLDLTDTVEFLGDVADRGHLAQLFRDADLFCLPSRLETFGFVFIEAMAAGLPVIAADAGAAPEVLGGAGILIAPNDAGAFAEAIAELLANAQGRSDMGRRGAARAAAFPWKAATDRYLAVIHSVID
jgi:glycosyltransferase involved in cell wall biosynthesis